MEGHIAAIAKLLDFTAHVLENQTAAVNFQPTSREQAQNQTSLSHCQGPPAALVDQVPSELEVSQISVGDERILVTGVKQREILDDHRNEEIQEHESNNDVERDEIHKGGGFVAAIRFPEVVGLCAVRWLDHTVVHDFVPVLSGGDTKEEYHGVGAGAEIRIAVDRFSKLDRSEEHAARQRVADNENEQHRDDEETLHQTHHHCQHETLQHRMLSGEGQEPEDNYTDSKSCRYLTQPALSFYREMQDDPRHSETR